MARLLSIREVRALLRTEEGRLYSAAVRRALRVESQKIGLGLRTSKFTARRLEQQLVQSILRSYGNIATRGQQIPRLRGIVTSEARVNETVRGLIRTYRDQLRDGLRILARNQGRSLAVASQRIRGLTLTEHSQTIQRFAQREIRSRLNLAFAESWDERRLRSEITDVIRRTETHMRAVARTAGNHVANRAREAAIADKGFKLVRYVAILDDRTTEICQSLNGEVFSINQGPRPPQHIQCRSFIAPAMTQNPAFGGITFNSFEKAA